MKKLLMTLVGLFLIGNCYGYTVLTKAVTVDTNGASVFPITSLAYTNASGDIITNDYDTLSLVTNSVQADGSVTMTGPLNMGLQSATNAADFVAATEESLTNTARTVGGIIVYTSKNVNQFADAKADMVSSEAATLADYSGSTEYIDLFANLTDWHTTTTTNLQVIGGAVFSDVGVSGGSSANAGFEVEVTESMRCIWQLNMIDGGSGGVIVGVNDQAADANASMSAANARGVYLKSNGSVPLYWDKGLGSNCDGSTDRWDAYTNAAYTVCVNADTDGMWCIINAGYDSQWRAEYLDRSTFDINNLNFMNSDVAYSNGCSILAVGAVTNYSTFNPTTELEGIAPTTIWTSNGTNEYKIELPTNYTSVVKVPVVVMFHGNGGDAHSFTDSTRAHETRNKFLQAGYAVLSATYLPNKSTWGAQASVDVYVAAYQWAISHFNLGDVVIYANSMGGIESLNTLMQGDIKGVKAWTGSVPACYLYGNYISGNSGSTWSNAINTAYSISGDYAEKTDGLDPYLQSAKSMRGIPMYWLVTTDDVAVDPANNYQLFYPKFSEYSIDSVLIESTGGHSKDWDTEEATMITWLEDYIDFDY